MHPFNATNEIDVRTLTVPAALEGTLTTEEIQTSGPDFTQRRLRRSSHRDIRSFRVTNEIDGRTVTVPAALEGILTTEEIQTSGPDFTRRRPRRSLHRDIRSFTVTNERFDVQVGCKRNLLSNTQTQIRRRRQISLYHRPNRIRPRLRKCGAGAGNHE